MVESIGPLHNVPPQPTTSSPNVPTLVKRMQEQVETMAKMLKDAMKDPSVTIESSFLQRIAEEITRLNHTVEESIKLR